MSTSKIIGFEQITDLSSAVGLSSVPNGAYKALVQTEGQNVRWRADGTNPEAGVGMVLTADGPILEISGRDNLVASKFIEETADSGDPAALNVTYFGSDI